MSTNAIISNGKTSIYCHWDGYLAGVGKTLLNHYTSQEKVDALLALGNISILEAEVEPSTEEHSFDKPEKGVTIAYHRDRGEELDFGDDWTGSYYYLFENGEWKVETEDSDYESLADKLAEESDNE